MVWGKPSARELALSNQGRVILAGLVAATTAPTHVCSGCATEFIATNRIYRRAQDGDFVFGVSVWPHGRRQVRIEATTAVWTIVVEGEGSMLVDRRADAVFPAEVFDGMWPWEVEKWARRRGCPVEAVAGEEMWTIKVPEDSLFELVVAKAWWRTLGRNPVEKAIEQLSREPLSPMWLPDPLAGVGH